MKNEKNVIEKFKSSSNELTKPLNVAVTSVLLALAIVFGYFANISINFLGTNEIKIGFSVVPIVIVAILYGPVPAAIVGGLTDIVGYILAPMGAYIPGFTISFILVGMIYGIAFYKEKVGLTRIIVTELIVTIFINIALGVMWFKIFYGTPLTVALKIRGLKEIVDLPLSIFINYFAIRFISNIPEYKQIMKKKEKALTK